MEDFITGKLENRYKSKEFKSDLLVRTYIAPFILLLASAFVLKKEYCFI